MARIFISYKRIDKTRVFEIRDLIESKIGEECWIDLDGIESDAQFKNVIIRAINQCEVVLFMYSKAHADIRDFEKDWTVRELNYASAKEKRIVFVNIDGTPLTDEFEFDFGLKQRIDGRSSDSLNRLIRDLKKWLNTSTPPPIIVNPPEPEEDANVLFEKGRYYRLSGDYSTAVKYFRKAAEQGHAEAQFNIGVMYDTGEGVSKDYIQAVRWYRKSALLGHAEAQFNLGVMYANGVGVSKDCAEAVRWYRKAAEQGYALAQNNLGEMYYNGEGVSKDYSEAFRWYWKAAEQGYVGAQNNLGDCYYFGRGVPLDYVEAVKWYRKAAEKGYAVAQYNLALNYYQGTGVAQNRVEAKKWLEFAANQGFKSAKELLKKQPFIALDNPKTVSTTAQKHPPLLHKDSYFKRFVRKAFSPNMIPLILPCLLIVLIGLIGLALYPLILVIYYEILRYKGQTIPIYYKKYRKAIIYIISILYSIPLLFGAYIAYDEYSRNSGEDIYVDTNSVIDSTAVIDTVYMANETDSSEIVKSDTLKNGITNIDDVIVLQGNVAGKDADLKLRHVDSSSFEVELIIDGVSFFGTSYLNRRTLWVDLANDDGTFIGELDGLLSVDDSSLIRYKGTAESLGKTKLFKDGKFEFKGIASDTFVEWYQSQLKN